MTMRPTRWLLPAVAAGLILAGCGGKNDTASTAGPSSSDGVTTTANSGSGGEDYGGEYGPPSSGSATSSTAPSSGSSMPSSGGRSAVKTATTPLGEILVDGDGKTLYLFEKDTATSSACNGGCATSWPPVTGKAEPASGLDAAGFTTVTRQDGSSQVAYKGHPLYRYASDKKPGDTTGQGSGGSWYVVGKDGKKIDKD